MSHANHAHNHAPHATTAPCQDIVEARAISNAQLETIVYAYQRFGMRLPDGARAGFFLVRAWALPLHLFACQLRSLSPFSAHCCSHAPCVSACMQLLQPLIPSRYYYVTPRATARAWARAARLRR